MAPMVDMVFLLLVFFMCVTAVSGGRAGAQIALPQTHAASALGANATLPQIVLSVGEEGGLSVNGKLCERGELVPLLRKLRQESGGEPAVRIRAHSQASYRQIEPLLSACAQAGLSKVGYAANEAVTLHPVLQRKENAAVAEGGLK